MSDYDNEIADHSNYGFERFSINNSQRKIKINRCQCAKCLTIIESKHRHDFVQCACGRVFTDGGADYIRRGQIDGNDIIDLTEYEDLPLTSKAKDDKIGL